MYADDLVLISSSVCELQRMFDVCAYILTDIGMQINTQKCAILRFGPQHANSWLQDSPIDFCDRNKYLAFSCSQIKHF
jgi:Reverse transcriptase (RNA-dependent DNA polymerase)